MAEIRCWFCRRTEEALKEAFPKDFWHDQISPFKEYTFTGKIIEVGECEKVTKDAGINPDLEMNFHTIEDTNDSRELIGVIGRRVKLHVCAICQHLAFQITDAVLKQNPDQKEYSYDLRYLYDPGKARMLIRQLWEKKKTESRKIKADYPEEALQILQALKNLNPEFPVFVPRLAKLVEMNERETTRLLHFILNQNPAIGKYDETRRAFIFNNPAIILTVIDNIIQEYKRNLSKTV
ncbi:MAG: tetratricopeptide repeat protein [Candidatus Hermodarchaeota archaeon]